jgi:phosphoribosylaminoimidazole-succinocarboxamide synthase
MTHEAWTRIEIPGAKAFKSGKVRDVFDLGDCFLFIASDRISAFDCILPNGIPQKGQVLSTLSAWWFEQTKRIVPNHLLDTRTDDLPAPFRAHAARLAGRSMRVRKAEVLPIECIVRGYLIGSGWKEYQASRSIGGMPLRAGYRMAGRLDEPIFTPSSKAASGHDENISFDETARRVGKDLAAQLRDASLALYRHAAAYALDRGIIIADTKFEFGLADGRLTLVDEALTPDSSRFWPASDYRPGASPPSFDKQYVRDYLESLDWDKTPPAPPLPDEVVRRTREKYLEAFRRITGRELGAPGA